MVGQPLERDGSEGKIGKLVRYFVQVLSDAPLGEPLGSRLKR